MAQTRHLRPRPFRRSSRGGERRIAGHDEQIIRSRVTLFFLHSCNYVNQMDVSVLTWTRIVAERWC